jgi:hypothetical protein
MALDVRATILGWSCYPAPEQWLSPHFSQETQLSVEGLDLDFIPSALRRRCSTLSRVTLAVAHAAARRCADRSSLSTVFSSAHGESEVTAHLLSELANSQQLSPMGFSLSVHNAASGIFSIATGNSAPSTAIAAGHHSFLMGLCEALLVLADAPGKMVLYVCSDDRVPLHFLQAPDPDAFPFAVALLLSSTVALGACDVSVKIGPLAGQASHCLRTASTAAPVQSFMSLLLDRTNSVELEDTANSWHFSSTKSRADLFASPLRAQ